MTHAPELQVAQPAHLGALLPLVRAYHAFEEIARSDADREAAVSPLLGENPYGCIWLILAGEAAVGYVALCFGYSIEFGGRDAFVDEFFLLESARGQGIGRRVLAMLGREAAARNIVALHLEVARSNSGARRFYERLGFVPRDRYHLMSWPIAG